MLPTAIDNVWHHWWAGHMRAVGAETRLPLLPIEEDFFVEHRTKQDEPGRNALDDQAAPRPALGVALPQKAETTIRRNRSPRQSNPKKALAKEVGDVAVDVLDRLILAPTAPSPGFDHTYVPGRRHLGDCDFFLLHDLIDKMEGGGRYYLRADDQDASELSDIFWPLDMAVIVQKDNDTLFAQRMATVTAKEIRGLVKRVPLKCMALVSAYLPRTGAWEAQTSIIGLINRRWINLEKDVMRSQRSGIRGDTVYTMLHTASDAETDLTTRMVFSLRLSQRYDWHVAFGLTMGGPRLMLPTNPRGCLELFRNRNHAPGEHRRGALRHWVNEHYRQRSGDGDLAYVCEHLRGNTRFEWNGLACELMVSEFDLEKNEFFRQRAAEWRARRQHNRIRVKLKR